MENRIFIPQTALDQWVTDGAADLRDGELTVAPGRKIRLTEAVRILREVGGGRDEHELVGRVKLRAQLEELGAEIVETSMLVGDAAFDVDPGWIGAASVVDRSGSPRSKRGDAAEPSDEEIFAKLSSG